MLENFKEEFQKNLKKNQEALHNPQAPGAADLNRKMGLAGMVVGIIGAIASLATYVVVGRVFVILLAVTIGGLAVGAKMLITGKK
ncbi:hypothetical protein K1X76_06650 [bacterium]|nr:hypothetical protein [bacterium]